VPSHNRNSPIGRRGSAGESREASRRNSILSTFARAGSPSGFVEIVARATIGEPGASGSSGSANSSTWSASIPLAGSSRSSERTRTRVDMSAGNCVSALPIVSPYPVQRSGISNA
jgi:hypothetical protein